MDDLFFLHEFKIDKLTNSILNTISGDSFQTGITLLAKQDLKTVLSKYGWNFDWSKELKYNVNLNIMGLVREPKGVDFIIQSQPLTSEEEIRLSEFIRQRKTEIQKRKTGLKKTVVQKRKVKAA